MITYCFRILGFYTCGLVVGQIPEFYMQKYSTENGTIRTIVNLCFTGRTKKGTNDFTILSVDPVARSCQT
jgi:hypothetical protein